MTQGEFDAALASGSIQSDDSGTDDAQAPSTSGSDSISQFLPILTQLQSVQQCLTAAPTFVPQTFQDQIQFVYTGGDYYLYLYFNSQWNAFSVSGGGGSGVSEILAGTGISISPSGGTGNVTITATGVQTVSAGAGISVSTSGGTATVSNGGVRSITAGSGISVSSSTGAITVSATGTGTAFSSVSGTDSYSGISPFTVTHTVTHGLGKRPVIISVVIPNLVATVPTGGGSGSTSLNNSAWIYLDTNGNSLGGMAFTYYITYGGTGSSTLTGVNLPGNQASSSFSTSGGTAHTTVTVNNVTDTTFDIVYAATDSSGSSFTSPTISWTVIG